MKKLIVLCAVLMLSGQAIGKEASLSELTGVLRWAKAHSSKWFPLSEAVEKAANMSQEARNALYGDGIW